MEKKGSAIPTISLNQMLINFDKSFLITILSVFFFKVLNSLKLPTHCLNECSRSNLGNKLRSNYEIEAIEKLCTHTLRRNTLACLRKNCETPSFERYNIAAFENICFKSSQSKKYQKDSTTMFKSMLENAKKANPWVTSEIEKRHRKKRLSYVGGLTNPKIKDPKKALHN